MVSHGEFGAAEFCWLKTLEYTLEKKTVWKGSCIKSTSTKEIS